MTPFPDEPHERDDDAEDPIYREETGEVPYAGIPPEELPSKEEPLPDDEDLPELEPEFMEALRAAGPEKNAPGAAEPDPEPEPAPDPDPDPAPAAEAEPDPDPAPDADPAPVADADAEPDPGATVEYNLGEAPDEQADGEEADAPIEASANRTPADRTAIMPDGRQEVREAFVVAAKEGEPFAPPRPPSGGDPESAPTHKRMWLRFVLGSFLIVVSFASATTATTVLEIDSAIGGITVPPGVEKQLEAVDPGEPQTFLILGSDRRKDQGTGERGLSDTTILLRLDPEKDRIAILNIPRDLKVEIPGGFGTNKFNAAYAFGGPKLTLRTVKSITAGTGLTINHLVNIDFLGFAQAINAIDCVYIDVDRDYFHSNEGVPAELQYDEIDIDPGYQRLCGEDALDYARYRYTDTDLVRAARQQDFLREARSRVPPIKLIRDREELFNIFAKHTQSDINDFGAAVEVIRLMIGSISAPIEEIRFPARLGPSYVYASRSAIKGAIEQFLDIEGSSGPRGTLDDPDGGSDTAGVTETAGSEGPEPGRQGAGKPNKQKGDSENSPQPENDGLIDAADGGLAVAKTLTPDLSPEFPVFYPRRLPSGSIYQEPRTYHVNDTDDETHSAYRMVLTVDLPDGTHYFGVQGIRDWEDPPILGDPSETREIDGRDYDLYVENGRIRIVAWQEKGNSYWVSNSLLQTLTSDQMLGIAASVGDITPNPKRRPKQERGRGKQ